MAERPRSSPPDVWRARHAGPRVVRHTRVLGSGRAHHARGRQGRTAHPRRRRRATLEGHRRTRPRPGRGPADVPTTGTSPPRTSSSAVPRTSTAPSPRTTGSLRRVRRAPPRCGWSPPALADVRLVGRRPLGGRGRHRRHAVPRRLGDHGARPARAQRARRHPPAVRRSPATSPAPSRPSATVEEGVVEESAPDAIGRVVDARRDRPGRRRGRRRPHRGVPAAGAARRPRVGRGLGEDARPGPGRGRRARRRPAAAGPGRGERGRGVRPLARRRPLHLPRLPRVPPRGGRRGPGPAGAPRHRPRHPARRPGHVGAPSASCRRWCRPRPARRRCSSSPRPTRGPPCTARPTSTTSASRRSTRRARSSASSASSACSPAPPTPSRSPGSRCCARRSATVMRQVGFDPRSHAGKALMDTLENYPRDELFHTSADELAPTAQAVMYARERRQLRLFARRDTYGRYVSVLVYLPRDRYNTTRPRAVLPDPQGPPRRRQRGVHRPRQRGHQRPRPLRRPPAQGRDRPRRGRRRPRAADGRGLALVARRLHRRRRHRVRRGAGLAPGPPWVGAFPEAYKEDFNPARRPRTSAAIEAIEGDEGIDLALFEQVDAGRGEARLKVFRVGPPLSLSGVLPMLSSMGVEVVDERPYTLEGLGAGVLRLRVRAALRPQLPRHRARPVLRRAARRVGGPQRDRRLQPAGARRRADVAPGHRAARLREVHAPGQHPVRARLHRGRAGQQRRHHPAAGPAVRGPLRPRRRRRSPTTRSARRGREGRGAAGPRPRRRGQPRPRPDPAVLPHARPGDAAHQLLPDRRRRRRCTPTWLQARAVVDPRPARAAARVRDLRLLARASRACTCASARSPAVACAGPTDATTSAPRSSAWSRRRWSRTP